jgi:hypothetical protein
MSENELKRLQDLSERLGKLHEGLSEFQRFEISRMELYYRNLLRRSHFIQKSLVANLDARRNAERSVKKGFIFSAVVFLISSIFLEDLRSFLIVNIFGSVGFFASLAPWFLQVIRCDAVDRQLVDIETEIKKMGLETIDYYDSLWGILSESSISDLSNLSIEDQCKRLGFFLAQRRDILVGVGVDGVWEVWNKF